MNTTRAKRTGILICFWLAFAVIALPVKLHADPATARKAFPDSIVPVPTQPGFTVQAILPDELESKKLEFSISLQMTNLSEFQKRVAKGEIIPQSELDEKYLPSVQDYKSITNWLITNGFVITKSTSDRLTVYAIGTLGQIKTNLAVRFSKVTVDHVTYDAATTAPSLPTNIAGPVLGINGLQPFLKARKHMFAVNSKQASTGYKVADVLKAYNAQNVGVTGAGQTIAILIDTFPGDSDLATFWANNLVSADGTRIEKINVNGVQNLPAKSGEETLDAEWTSGIAPSAKIRIYATGSLEFIDIDKALDQIKEDLIANTNLHQVSISLGLGETYMSRSEVTNESMKFAFLAARGASIFVSSGDAGSNPDQSGHSSTGPTQAEYQSSDISVTAVGGTSLTFDGAGTPQEMAWPGGGGGYSVYFDRPIWQKGTGVKNRSHRQVPDVSLVADPNTGAFTIYQGVAQQVGGTSLSAPVWAGFCALINEARQKKQKTEIGLLNPHIYPLIGTKNFRDITKGSNGKYCATKGYDMVTGIGVPNMSELINTLSN